MGSSEPTPQIPQKHGIFGTFPRNRAELGCRSKTEDIVTDGFIPHGLSAKRKSVTMILPIKNEGIFIVTLVFSEHLYDDFYLECGGCNRRRSMWLATYSFFLGLLLLFYSNYWHRTVFMPCRGT